MPNHETQVSKRIDMSPAAIDRRLRDLSELYDLGASLAQARRIGSVSQLRANAGAVASADDCATRETGQPHAS